MKSKKNSDASSSSWRLVLFNRKSQKPKDIQFPLINDGEKQQILSCGKLEPENVTLLMLFIRNCITLICFDLNP